MSKEEKGRMHRLTLNIDVSENLVLTDEIDEMIRNEVKGKTREYFHATLDSELTRIAERTTNDWNNSGYRNGNSRLTKEVARQIDTQITKAIGEIEVSSHDIRKTIDEKLADIDAKIDYLLDEKFSQIDKIIEAKVSERMENKTLEEYITDRVDKQVHIEVPQSIVKLLTEKETS